MKLIKKTTPYTLVRDLIRIIPIFVFFVLYKLFAMDIEIESEYAVLLSILFFGPIFCGYACPFGNASYFITKLGNKLFPSWQFNVPAKFDRVLRTIRYFLLAYFLFLFIYKGVDYFGNHIIMYKSTKLSWWFIKFKFIAVLLIPFFIPQFFCKYLCWQKAGYNLINRIIPFVKIKRDTESCIGCKKCDKACPMDIKISEQTHIAGNDCLGCFNCLDTDACPPKIKALSLHFMGKKVNLINYVIIALLFYVLCTLFFLLVI